jgi:hypothetical protein
MKRRKLFVWALCCAWLTTVSVESGEAAPQGNPEEGQAVLPSLMDGWRPFTSEEEIRIAGYLKQEAEVYLKLLEPFAEPECDESESGEPECDEPESDGPESDARESNAPESNEPKSDDESSEETDDAVQLVASDLTISLKEIITTLGLMDKMFRQRPADYVRTAPLLWLTVAKNIALDEKNLGEIERLELVESNWKSIVDVALPRLFSRILEPKLGKFQNDNGSEYALGPWDIPPF